MYTNSAYWHQTRLDFKDKKHPIFIGTVKLIGFIPLKDCRLTVQEDGLIISFSMLLLEKLISFSMGKKKSYLPVIWYYTDQKKNSAITIMEQTIQKYTGYILQGTM